MSGRRLGFTVALLAAAAAATAGIAHAREPYKSPVRRAQLARLDAEVRFVVHYRWRPKIHVETWRGNPYIVVARTATLADVRRVAPQLLRTNGAGVWRLRVPLFVVHGATLDVAAPAVRVLRLVALAKTYATIVAYGSNIRIVGDARHRLRVASQDALDRGPDLDLDDGRGSVSVRGGRLYASYADFSYLGFSFGRASGVAVNGLAGRAKGSGRVDHSTFSHNVFGAYTWEATRMRWTRNRFTHNAVYGFDPHDGSNWFLVDHNYAAYNGRHGIIFSRKCWHDIVRQNASVHNGWHGIVVDDGRDGKIAPSGDVEIYDNVVRANRRVGISIDGSNRNVVRDNRVSGGLVGIRVFGRSNGVAESNVVVGNSIAGAHEIGILIQRPAVGTYVARDRIVGSVIGIALHGSHRTTITRSVVRGARLHAVSVVDGGARMISFNRFAGSGPSVINRVGDVIVPVKGNVNTWRYPLLHSVARVMSWVIGPGLWALLLLVTLVSGTLVKAVDTVRSFRRPDGKRPRLQRLPPSA